MMYLVSGNLPILPFSTFFLPFQPNRWIWQTKKTHVLINTIYPSTVQQTASDSLHHHQLLLKIKITLKEEAELH